MLLARLPVLTVDLCVPRPGARVRVTLRRVRSLVRQSAAPLTSAQHRDAFVFNPCSCSELYTVLYCALHYTVFCTVRCGARYDAAKFRNHLVPSLCRASACSPVRLVFRAPSTVDSFVHTTTQRTVAARRLGRFRANLPPYGGNNMRVCSIRAFCHFVFYILRTFSTYRYNNSQF